MTPQEQHFLHYLAQFHSLQARTHSLLPIQNLKLPQEGFPHSQQIPLLWIELSIPPQINLYSWFPFGILKTEVALVLFLATLKQDTKLFLVGFRKIQPFDILLGPRQRKILCLVRGLGDYLPHGTLLGLNDFIHYLEMGRLGSWQIQAIDVINEEIVPVPLPPFFSLLRLFNYHFRGFISFSFIARFINFCESGFQYPIFILLFRSGGVFLTLLRPRLLVVHSLYFFPEFFDAHFRKGVFGNSITDATNILQGLKAGGRLQFLTGPRLHKFHPHQSIIDQKSILIQGLVYFYQKLSSIPKGRIFWEETRGDGGTGGKERGLWRGKLVLWGQGNMGGVVEQKRGATNS